MKLKSSDLAKYRKLQWEAQGKICPLCETEIPLEDVVLDHDHDSGHCRRSLHRACNTAEGKIKKDFIRYISGKGLDFKRALENLLNYLKEDYTQNPIHPTELTPLEKELKFTNKRLKTLKRESSVVQYKARAKELRLLIKAEREQNSWREE